MGGEKGWGCTRRKGSHGCLDSLIHRAFGDKDRLLRRVEPVADSNTKLIQAIENGLANNGDGKTQDGKQD